MEIQGPPVAIDQFFVPLVNLCGIRELSATTHCAYKYSQSVFFVCSGWLEPASSGTCAIFRSVSSS
jgi:hypothetical protein